MGRVGMSYRFFPVSVSMAVRGFHRWTWGWPRESNLGGRTGQAVLARARENVGGDRFDNAELIYSMTMIPGVVDTPESFVVCRSHRREEHDGRPHRCSVVVAVAERLERTGHEAGAACDV